MQGICNVFPAKMAKRNRPYRVAPSDTITNNSNTTQSSKDKGFPASFSQVRDMP
jgi:hypothetical protein